MIGIAGWADIGTSFAGAIAPGGLSSRGRHATRSVQANAASAAVNVDGAWARVSIFWMPPTVDFAAWDLAGLAEAWRRARPFSHVVVDGLLPDEGLAELCRAVAEEPHWPSRDEIYEMMGSAQPPRHPTLTGFERSLGSDDGLRAIQAVSAQPVVRVEMRSYVFLPGQYLLSPPARLPYAALRELLDADAASARRARVAPGLEPFFVADQGRYQINRRFADAGLGERLRQIAALVVDAPLTLGRARWLRLGRG